MKFLLGMVSLIITVAVGWLIVNQFDKNEPDIPEKNEVKAETPAEFAVWEWRRVGQLDAEEIVATAKKEEITVIYLNVNEYSELMELPEGNERNTKTEQFMERLTSFMKVMNRNGIEVHALAGHNNWGNDSHWYLVDYIIDLVRDFNKTHPETPFAGVQLDIEPYGQLDWDSEKKEYLRMYLEMVTIMGKRMQNELPGRQFGLAIPAWYATNKVNDKIILTQVLDRLPVYDNYIALMSYRNFTKGKDGTISLAKPTFKLITEKGSKVRVVVGQETGKATPEKVTFHGKSRKEFDNALDHLRTEYGDEEIFSGFAVNDLQSFLQLAEQ